MAILTDRRTSLSGRGSPPWPVVKVVEVERSAGQGPEAGFGAQRWRRLVYIYIYINKYLFIYIGNGTSSVSFVGSWCSLMV